MMTKNEFDMMQAEYSAYCAEKAFNPGELLTYEDYVKKVESGEIREIE